MFIQVSNCMLNSCSSMHVKSQSCIVLFDLLLQQLYGILGQPSYIVHQCVFLPSSLYDMQHLVLLCCPHLLARSFQFGRCIVSFTKSPATFVYICLTHISLASFLWDIGKQKSPRCDAAKRGVRSEAILFAFMNFIEK